MARSGRVALILKSLQTALRSDQIETNIEELATRGKPWNSYHKSDNIPDIIVYPETTGIHRVSVHRRHRPI